MSNGDLLTWDKITLTVTAIVVYITNHVEGVNLFLAIVLKLATLINIFIYIALNWRRIYVSFRRLFKNKKK